MEDKKLSDEDIERILSEYRAKKVESETNPDTVKNTEEKNGFPEKSVLKK